MDRPNHETTQSAVRSGCSSAAPGVDAALGSSSALICRRPRRKDLQSWRRRSPVGRPRLAIGTSQGTFESSRDILGLSHGAPPSSGSVVVSQTQDYRLPARRNHRRRHPFNDGSILAFHRGGLDGFDSHPPASYAGEGSNNQLTFVDEDAAAKGNEGEAHAIGAHHQGYGVEHEELEGVVLGVLRQRFEHRGQRKASEDQTDCSDDPSPGTPADRCSPHGQSVGGSGLACGRCTLMTH